MHKKRNAKKKLFSYVKLLHILILMIIDLNV